MMIENNLADVLRRINDAAKAVGRNQKEVTLIAVSKTFGIDRVIEAYDAGLRDFGENRIQEAKEKVKHTKEGMRWHFIGRLQSNKAKTAARCFDMVHSLDSVRLARILDKHCNDTGKALDVMLQVNIAGEGQKSGVTPADACDAAKEILLLNNLKLRGLMTIPPYSVDKEDSRQYYKAMRELKGDINDRLGEEALKGLSMGMSGDYEVAIQEGATYIRIGTAIFGERK